jgi:hypothetical protein
MSNYFVNVLLNYDKIGFHIFIIFVFNILVDIEKGYRIE